MLVKLHLSTGTTMFMCSFVCFDNEGRLLMFLAVLLAIVFLCDAIDSSALLLFLSK